MSPDVEAVMDVMEKVDHRDAAAPRAPTRRDISAPSRLDAVRASGLLAPDAQRRLDVLCETSTQVLHVPVSLVSLITDSVSISAGKYPEGSVEQRVSPLANSVCSLVVDRGELLRLTDLAHYPPTAPLPAVVSGQFRAYLGVPIWWRGQAIGSFCAVDTKPRQWTDRQVAILECFAELAWLAVDPGDDHREGR